MPDKEIVCKDCNGKFTITEGEQQFFAEKGFQEPKRCKPCRQQRKLENNNKSPQEDHDQQRSRPSNPRPVQWTNGADAVVPERASTGRGARRERSHERRRDKPYDD